MFIIPNVGNITPRANVCTCKCNREGFCTCDCQQTNEIGVQQNRSLPIVVLTNSNVAGSTGTNV